MIRYKQGNLLEEDVQALVNTVNTVGVMGKGIALMFKERFPVNMRAYEQACKAGQVQVGRMFVTETGELAGPRWIVNFPTKQHWRHKSQLKWIEDGLVDLRRFIEDQQVRSVAIPPLGTGNGGLRWADVKPRIEHALQDLPEVDIVVFEPTQRYQNVAKRKGVEQLTPARALIAELVRRYWILGMECSLLEIQKLAWFLERAIAASGQPSLDLRFSAGKYGPYADRLRHLLDALDGSYLHADKRISDSSPLDPIWFDDGKQHKVSAYLQSQTSQYLPALDRVSRLVDGFESPFGMELLATVDWLQVRQNAGADTASTMTAMRQWPAGPHWAQRKSRLFKPELIQLALQRLAQAPLATPAAGSHRACSFTGPDGR